MENEELIDFDTEIPALLNITSGKIGIILAHGEKTEHNRGIIKSISKKLSEKNISSVRFPYPYKIRKEKYKKNTQELDEAFIHVYRYITQKYSELEWFIGGHDIGAESALRISPIASEYGDLPPLICLGYPLYPPNQPAKVNMTPLGAIIGDALFCQGTESNRGDYRRLDNSIQMMAEHVHVKPIKGADHNMEVKEKTNDRVAYWISNDIERFIKELGR